MTTLVPNRHPALDIAESERADYLTVIASMAYADEDTDGRELEHVRDLCTLLEISEEHTARVLAVAAGEETPDNDALVRRLRSSELRFALMVDALDIAYADDEIVASEAKELDTLADRLGVTEGQLAMLRRYVEARTHHEVKDAAASRDVATGLASAGVPAAALGIAAAVGAPLVAGIGIAAALGVGSFVSLRWLLKKRSGDSKSVATNIEQTDVEQSDTEETDAA